MSLKSARRAVYDRMKGAIIPGVRTCQSLYAEALEERVRSGMRWLDLGCGHRILGGDQLEAEEGLVARCGVVVGIDCDLPSLKAHRTIAYRVRGDATQLPFPDNTFDLVTANMVVEHLPDPARPFSEVCRVLKPGGLFLFHTPNSRGYYVLLARLIPKKLKPRLVRIIEGRLEEDVFPTFYQANTPGKVCELASDCGFEVVRVRTVVSTGHARLAIIPPVSALQLLWIRLLMLDRLKPLRPYLISTLRKKSHAVDA